MTRKCARCVRFSLVTLTTVTLLVLTSLTSVTSQCVLEPPCRTCDKITIERDNNDCNKYFYCYYGRLWSKMRCRSNQIYSTEVKACVYKHTATECNNNFVEPVTPPPVYTWTNWTQPYYPVYQPIPSVTIVPKPPEIVSPFKRSCGIKRSPWIVGGNEAVPGEWAWQVSLQMYRPKTREFVHVCGGALVHDSWVVTAAHCVYSQNKIYMFVVAGAHILGGSQPEEQRRTVAKVIPNPNYRHYGNFPHDIALLQLSAPMKMSRSVSTVCLPSQGEDPVLEYKVKTETTGCWVTGWGLTLEPRETHQLNEVKVELINQIYCSWRWGGYVSDSHLCAGEGDTGACRGDSGGPLVCTSKGQFSLEGVVSWGEDTCLLKGYPNVFTKVSLYTDWINGVIGLP